MSNTKIYLYAVHDPWFHGLRDGDVDDRMAFCAYDHFLRNELDQRIVVYVGERLEETVKHYGHFRIEFKDTLNLEEVSQARKVCICAPIHDAQQRSLLALILESKQNGYCQGCKIGCMNFPNQSYMPLLESIPNKHRFSTVDTMITFPVSFLQKMDPTYHDYLKYGFMKLISPGSIAHIPGLLYRLYCPELGGGPGTNMLSIQRYLQKYFNLLPEMPIDKDHFVLFNRTLIEQLGVYTPHAILQMPIIQENPVLRDAITVMVYFANLIYLKEGTHDPLYENDTPLYSLNTLPKGSILLLTEQYLDGMESPPLYDLIAAHAVLYDHFPTQEEILAFYDRN
jgi:hypothetical protein